MKTFGLLGGDEEGDCITASCPSHVCTFVSPPPPHTITTPHHDPCVNNLPTVLLLSSNPKLSMSQPLLTLMYNLSVVPHLCSPLNDDQSKQNCYSSSENLFNAHLYGTWCLKYFASAVGVFITLNYKNHDEFLNSGVTSAVTFVLILLSNHRNERNKQVYSNTATLVFPVLCHPFCNPTITLLLSSYSSTSISPYYPL